MTMQWDKKKQKTLHCSFF